MRNMVSSTLTACWCLAVIMKRVDAFSSISFRLQSPSILYGISPTPNTRSKVPMNPSSEFGRPLNEATQNFNKAAIAIIKNSIFDTIYASNPSSDRDECLSRSYARFYALETIARAPYFSYLSVLHLYETLGWWRRSSYLKLHFCESWNELHHLLIMEELGGNLRWIDQFFAQHIAFFYYWFVVTCYMFNPTLAYNLNQAVEEHAYETYDAFLNMFESELKEKDAPEVARKYYRDGDLYLFDEMHTCTRSGSMSIQGDDSASPPFRRPKVDTLYDVFVAIREDEKEHVRTMEYLQRKDADIEICDV